MARKKRDIPVVSDTMKYLADVTLTDSIQKSKEWALACLNEHDFNEDLGSTQTFISNVIIQPVDYFVATKFQKINVEDVQIAWRTFQEIILELNRQILFVPLKQTFCRYINISTSTYNQKLDEQSDMGDLFRMINDSLTGDFIQNLISGRIGTNQGIFAAKALFGLRDNDPPVTNVVQVNAPTKSLAEILEDYNKNGY